MRRRSAMPGGRKARPGKDGAWCFHGRCAAPLKHVSSTLQLSCLILSQAIADVDTNIQFDSKPNDELQLLLTYG